MNWLNDQTNDVVDQPIDQTPPVGGEDRSYTRILIALLLLGTVCFIVGYPRSLTVTLDLSTTSIPTGEEQIAPQSVHRHLSTEPEMSGVGPLLEVVALAKPMQCEVKSLREPIWSGQLLLAPEQFRIDVSFAESARTAGVVNDKYTTYFWDQDGARSIAYQAPTRAAIATSELTHMLERSDFTIVQEVTYNCFYWAIDAKVFTPPGDIDFTVLTADPELIAPALIEKGEADWLIVQ